ncbi:mitogen-activated kinase 9-like, partial [Olea europaea subsp. europaea]
ERVPVVKDETVVQDNDFEKRTSASVASTLQSPPNKAEGTDNSNANAQNGTCSARSLLKSASISASKCIGVKGTNNTEEESIAEHSEETQIYHSVVPYIDFESISGRSFRKLDYPKNSVMPPSISPFTLVLGCHAGGKAGGKGGEGGKGGVGGVGAGKGGGGGSGSAGGGGSAKGSDGIGASSGMMKAPGGGGATISRNLKAILKDILLKPGLPAGEKAGK